MVLTSLEKCKQGPALIGRLSGEAKASAKTLGVRTISSENGANLILEHLDKSYGVDKVDQMDIDLASFLDFSWHGNMAIEQFIAGFHTRIDKIADLHIDEKLKGHLLLRAAGLDAHMRNIIVGSSAGNYDIKSISGALRQAFRNNSKPSTMTSLGGDKPQQSNTECTKNSARKSSYKVPSSSSNTRFESESDDQAPVFASFQNDKRPMTFSLPNNPSTKGAILDSGACSSVVGKCTLDSAMRALKIDSVEDSNPKIPNHRFGCQSKPHPTLFAVLFPFRLKSTTGEPVTFKIHFDVIEGNLPFLIGLPSLRAMRASVNCELIRLGFKLKGVFHRVKLSLDEHHLYLPFRSSLSSYYSMYSYDGPEFQDQAAPSEEPKAYTPGSHYIPQTTDNAYSETMVKLPVKHKPLNPEVLKKLHLHLKHGSYTAMVDWIKGAGRWSPELSENIKSLLEECSCVQALEPLPHPVVSVNLPVKEVQSSLAIDCVYFEGVPCLHVLDKCTQWSEASVLRTRKLQHQAEVFTRIQIHRHGTPRVVTADNEYNKGAFKRMLDNFDIAFSPIAANDHEANGQVERGNRTLRSFFRRVRSEMPQASVSEILSGALFGKNICKGQKIASSFELLYQRKPRTIGELELISDTPVSISEHIRDATNRRLSTMIRKQARFSPKIKPGDYVFFWRDGKRWMGPGKVVKIEGNLVTLVHDERTKTSSLNRVRKTQPPIEVINDILDFEQCDETGADLDSRAESETMKNDSAHAKKFKHKSSREQSRKSRIAPELQHSNEHPMITRSKSAGRQGVASSSINTSIKRSTANVTFCADSVLSNNKAVPKQSSQHYFSIESYLKYGSISDANYLASPTDDICDNLTSPMASLVSGDLTPNEKQTAYRVERKKWADAKAMKIVQQDEVAADANIIGSHTTYLRKPDGQPKARICPWGNHDIEKLNLRTDCPSILMEIFRIVLSICAEKGWDIGSMDAVSAFLQATGFAREVYVLPPKEEQAKGVIWKLLAPAYGLVDSGRLWFLTSRVALCNDFGLSPSKTEPTLFYHKDEKDNLTLLVLVQVDNYIYTGEKDKMKSFEAFLSISFDIGTVERQSFQVYGSEINREANGEIVLSQNSKLEEISSFNLIQGETLHRAGGEITTSSELKLYRSLIGKLLFAGRLTQPVMLRIASEMATKVNKLQVHHLRDLRAHVKFALSVATPILYNRISQAGNFHIDVYSDANCPRNFHDAREGFIIVRRCNDVVHPVYWTSRKLRRVARSSSTAELIGAADAVDKALYIAAVLREILYDHDVHLATDSRSLFSLATSIRDPEESLNKLDLAAIRQAFENGMLRRICWCPGYYIIADTLTKNNRETAALLSKVFRTGLYPIHIDSVHRTTPKGEV